MFACCLLRVSRDLCGLGILWGWGLIWLGAWDRDFLSYAFRNPVLVCWYLLSLYTRNICVYLSLRIRYYSYGCVDVIFRD